MSRTDLCQAQHTDMAISSFPVLQSQQQWCCFSILWQIVYFCMQSTKQHQSEPSSSGKRGGGGRRGVLRLDGREEKLKNDVKMWERGFPVWPHILFQRVYNNSTLLFWLSFLFCCSLSRVNVCPSDSGFPAVWWRRRSVACWPTPTLEGI